MVVQELVDNITKCAKKIFPLTKKIVKNCEAVHQEPFIEDEQHGNEDNLNEEAYVNQEPLQYDEGYFDDGFSLNDSSINGIIIEESESDEDENAVQILSLSLYDPFDVNSTIFSIDAFTICFDMGQLEKINETFDLLSQSLEQLLEIINHLNKPIGIMQCDYVNHTIEVDGILSKYDNLEKMKTVVSRLDDYIKFYIDHKEAVNVDCLKACLQHSESLLNSLNEQERSKSTSIQDFCQSISQFSKHIKDRNDQCFEGVCNTPTLNLKEKFYI
ncbi:hypothetical protein AB837_00438 [bacterium AB1]|nr:hypothetical protein AB837_00438 [bacterium AB1]